LGAKVPGRAGAQRGIDYALRNKLFPKIHPRKFKLEDINEMIDLMKAGNIEEGRMVIHFD
jgi:propanol-preferring alcohol dehydrogenase